MALPPELRQFYERFFVLGEDFTPRALRVKAVDELDDPAAITRAERTPPSPLRFERDEGDVPLDWLGTTWAVLDIVSDRFIACLRARNFSGWTTYAVEITAGAPVEGYHGLAITGTLRPDRRSLVAVSLASAAGPAGPSVRRTPWTAVRVRQLGRQ